MIKNRIVKVIIILIIILLSPILLQSNANGEEYNTIEIQGTIKDTEGNAIKNIDIYFGNELKTTTNENGEYRFWIISKDKIKGTIKYDYTKTGNQYNGTSVKKHNIVYKNANESNIKNIKTVFANCNSNVVERYNFVANKLNKIASEIGLNYDYKLYDYNPNENFLVGIRNTIGSIGAGKKITNKLIALGYVDENVIENIQKISNYGQEVDYGIILNASNEEIQNKLEGINSNNKIGILKITENEANDVGAILDSAYNYLSIERVLDGEENIVINKGGNTIEIAQEIELEKDVQINLTLEKELNVSTPNTGIGSTASYKMGEIELGNGTSYYIDGYAKDKEGAKIKGVKVELYEGGNILAEVRTDENGYYKFNGIAAPEFLGFDPASGKALYNEKKYTVKFTYGDAIQLAESPKYNGQDYQTYSSADIIITEEEEEEPPIEIANKLEIYLVIDCSSSMVEDSKTNAKLPFLQNAKDGAKEFTKKIFETYGDNAKVGVIGFGSPPFQYLYDTSGRRTGYKFLEGSPIKHVCSLKGKDELESITGGIDKLGVINGGTFTHAGIELAIKMMNLPIASSEANKYIVIFTDGAPEDKNKTADAYKNAVNNGITPLTLFINSSKYLSSGVTEIVKGEYYTLGTEGLDESLKNLTYEYIKKETGGKGKTQITYEEGLSVAQDDAERRDEVNKNCSDIGYTKGEMLRKLETTGVDYTDVADATYMTASKEVILKKPGSVSDLRLILVERPKNEIEIEKKVTRIRVYLSDGSKLTEWNPNFPLKELNKNYILDTTTQKLMTLDDELMHGALMELTYKISVKNTGTKDYGNKYIINDYIEHGWGFSKGKDEAGNEINADWEIQENATMKIIDSMKTSNRTIVQSKEIENGDELEIVLTKVLSTQDDGRYENKCEIEKYTNAEGRRIYETTPANYNPDTGENKDEKDTAISELVGVVPPFGKNIINIGSIVSSIFIIICIISKMYKLKMLNKKQKGR